MAALYAAMYHKLSAYTTKSFIYRGMNTRYMKLLCA